MENAEEIFQFLEEFSKRKTKIIPQELNEYLAYVARTGDPVYQWSLVKSLFKEKLLSVITDFYETTPSIEIPPYPNVDPFNYDLMKNSLLERLDSFTSAPFTVQRICELLTFPRKQYNRVDKFMRAVEKNILVVSTREPGIQRHAEPENGEPMEPMMVNGSDNNSEYNVDVEMEDMSWKDQSNAVQSQASEPQPGSSDSHISVDDLEARLKAKQNAELDTHEKVVTQYESVTPPEMNVPSEEQAETKTDLPASPETPTSIEADAKEETTSIPDTSVEPKVDIAMNAESTVPALVIPEIKVDDAEMTEQRLIQQSSLEKADELSPIVDKEPEATEPKTVSEAPTITMDESSSDSTSREEAEAKIIIEVSTSSEESSSSSDNTDGNSNSPKTDERQIDIQEESNQSSQSDQSDNPQEEVKTIEQVTESSPPEDPLPDPSPPPSSSPVPEEEPQKVSIQSDNYSITDVNSELPQPTPAEDPKIETVVEEKKEIEESKSDESKAETEIETETSKET